jgi:hypothetical protein
MNRQVTIDKLCALVSEVGRRVFRDELEHDCFCSSLTPDHVQVHPEVFNYIADAVYCQMVRDKVAEDK